MFFSSDNVAAIAPEIMAAMADANHGGAKPYGNDAHTQRLQAVVSDVFEREARVYLVSTGTAANALALGCLCPPWATTFCHRNAHIEEDECGAPEFYTGGAKLTLLDGADAKVDPAALGDALRFAARAGVHNVQRGALSITQATEKGAAYTPDEIAALTGQARAHGLPVHMDGTRFANAVARLGASPADLSWRAGVDVLCLGATKNGAMAAEAVILFDPAKAWEFELRRKRGGHLWSKMRYLGAQMEAYLADGLWLRLAAHANAMADRLAAGLRALDGVEIAHPIGANMMFPRFPRRGHRALQAAGAVYYLWPGDQSLDGPDDGPDDGMVGCRLVCSWATTEAEVDAFLATLRAALAPQAAAQAAG